VSAVAPIRPLEDPSGPTRPVGPAGQAGPNAGGPQPVERSGDRDLDPALGRVLARVRLRARLRVEWLRTLWREAGPSFDPGVISHAEVDLALDDRDRPDDEAEWRRIAADPATLEALEAVEAAIAADTTSRLARLVRVFGLEPAEIDLVHACLAAAIDPGLLRVFGYVQDQAGRTQVTDSLVARLFGHGRVLGLDGDAAVARWLMVDGTAASPGEPRTLALDAALVEWLLGSDALDPELGDARRVEDRRSLREWPMDDTVASLERWLGGPEPTPVRIRVAGSAGSGRRTFAAGVAARLGLPLLAIAVDGIDGPAWSRLYVKAQRHAFLSGSALAFVSDGVLPAGSFDAIAHFPLQFVIGETSGRAGWNPRAVDHLVELPPPSLEGRDDLWRAYAPWSASWPAAERAALVIQHRSSPADLARLGLRGPSGPGEASALLREAARDSLGDLAQRLECPFRRDDLVLTPALERTLDELLFEAQDRATFWERPEARRLFPQGRGLLAMLCGPPGTGKTMTAQVVAAALGVDLFRIDLAAVVSKWVGETSRNLDRLLNRAAELDVVLLFDEADALFGRRTEIKEANDRFANTDTGYLLQAIETYRGIALLATNRKADIDPAFLRRLRYVVDYPVPDPSDRDRIWQLVLTELAGAARALELRADLERLAAAVEVTGAQIKFAVLSAVFSARRDARPVGPADLVAGLERELAKEGRPLGDRVRERLGHAT